MLVRLRVAVILFGVGWAGAVHYGDPNAGAGCLRGEVVVALRGLSGNFCSPPCLGAGHSCPTDVPPGVTATPACDVTLAGARFCSLECDPPRRGTPSDPAAAPGLTRSGNIMLSDGCGANASCKPISGTGVCTYDDTPAPPSSQHWVPVNSPSFEALTTAMAVSDTSLLLLLLFRCCWTVFTCTRRKNTL